MLSQKALNNCQFGCIFEIVGEINANKYKINQFIYMV